MNATEFCYWLRGALEVSKPEAFTKEHLAVISAHLDLVLKPHTTEVKVSTQYAPSPLSTKAQIDFEKLAAQLGGGKIC